MVRDTGRPQGHCITDLGFSEPRTTNYVPRTENGDLQRRGSDRVRERGTRKSKDDTPPGACEGEERGKGNGERKNCPTSLDSHEGIPKNRPTGEIPARFASCRKLPVHRRPRKMSSISTSHHNMSKKWRCFDISLEPSPALGLRDLGAFAATSVLVC